MCVGCLVTYGLIIVYLHFKSIQRLSYYEKQGAVLYPGCKRFFFGNTYDLMTYAKVRAGPEPVCGPQQWMIMNHFNKAISGRDDHKFASNEFPIIAGNFQSEVQLWINDPEIVQDILVGKNAIMDKQLDA